MEHKKSVLIVSHYAMPHVGGIEQVVQKNAMAFSEKDFFVNHIATASFGEKKGLVKVNKNLNVIRFPAFTFAEKKLNIPFPLIGVSSIISIWNFVKKADIVHVHDVFYQICWIASFFAWLQNKPVFLTQHVAIVEHKSKIVMITQKIVYGFFGKLIFNYSKKIIVYNKNVYDFLLEYNVDKNKIIETKNGIDLKLFKKIPNEEKVKIKNKYGVDKDKPVVLFVGRLVSKKGYDIVYFAHSEKYNTVFVGEGDVPDEWRKRKGVYFLGNRSENELSEIYGMADVFVFPSQGEIFTLTMQEAMAAGLPVITTKDSAYDKYDLDNGGISFVNLDTDSLKKEIEKIISDKKLHKKMSDFSIRFANLNFDWRKNIKNVIKIYDDFFDKKILVTTSWDDGHILDLKLAKLLKKYDIKGTFYISPENYELSKEKRLSKRKIIELGKDFEIGAHTMTHHHLTKQTNEVSEREISLSKKWLEKVLNKEVVSFCYPAGKYKKIHKTFVRKHGFKLARTVKRFVFSVGKDPYELGTSIHTYDHWLDAWKLLLFVKFNPFKFLSVYRKWDKQAVLMFDYVCKNGGVFHLWGHSFEIEEHNDLERLEKVLKHIAHNDGVRYITNGELYG